MSGVRHVHAASSAQLDGLGLGEKHGSVVLHLTQDDVLRLLAEADAPPTLRAQPGPRGSVLLGRLPQLVLHAVVDVDLVLQYLHLGKRRRREWAREEREGIKKLLALTGEVFEIDESLMDAITALAGSGPAFVAEIIDAYTMAGVKLGFKPQEALKLALQTFLGTLELLREENTHPSVFRDKVTSPAGTTVYGLHLLNERGLKGHLISAIEEAYKRARELS